MSNIYKFELGQRLKLVESGECGIVIGRAEYDFCDNQYLLRYEAGDGRQVESWWTESALKSE